MNTKRNFSDISLKLSQFLLKAVGSWITLNKAEERQRRINMLYTVASHIYALYINITDIYHSWGDFNYCMFIISNLLIVILSLSKFIILSFRRREFVKIIIYAQKNFWHFKYENYEKLLFTKCQKFCNLWTIIAYFFVQSSIFFYIITPFYVNHGKNKSERTLPVRMWIDIPLSTTPYYELLFASQLIALQQIGLTYLSNDNYLCVLSMHVNYQFRILQHRMLTIWSNMKEQKDIISYTDKYYKALKKCIKQHQSLLKYCEKLDYVYTLMILNHVIVFSLIMCIAFYEILIADVPLTTRFIFIFSGIGIFVHILFFTYICDKLIEESGNVGLAMYSGWWTTLPMNKTGKMLRKDIRMIMMKCMRPCYLSAGGFFPVSLETSTSLISSTVSYFTLLRESMK
ncbi:odorant receptor 30a-like [Apis laboriosa]|uniref:odorant receptor 30a-like n=1 Tax=Apis laboriosa TaxID=183418 RepID=UPI001CC43A25|nr:odorant receptor 30a-like [Apis laboriosa]